MRFARPVVVLASLGYATLSNQAHASTSPAYRVYKYCDGKLEESTFQDLCRNCADHRLILFGEVHTDLVAHQIQKDLYQFCLDTFGNDCSLSLEMLTRDAQLIVDEFLSGTANEMEFLRDAVHGWPDFKTDYLPLVELAKSNQCDVIAANCPLRYVSLSNRQGASILHSLSADAKTYFAELEGYKPMSRRLVEKTVWFMTGGHGSESESDLESEGCPMSGFKMSDSLHNQLEAQNLWDATMAHSIYRYFQNQSKEKRMLHITGKFHTEHQLGIPEHMQHYSDQHGVVGITHVSVSCIPVPLDEIDNLLVNPIFLDAAEWVIFTDETQCRDSVHK